MAKKLLIAGFDFGTSFSKAVVQDQATKEKIAVSFPGDQPYMLPSAIGFDGDSLLPPCADLRSNLVPYPKILSSYVADGRRGIRDLLHLPVAALEELDGEDRVAFTRRLLAWYFTCVLRGIRSFIPTAPSWKGFDTGGGDVWGVQMCVPTGLLQKGGAVEEFMQEALCMAWLLHSQYPDATLCSPVGYSEWRRMCDGAEGLLGDPGTRSEVAKHCAVYPEVAAGVQSILRSPNALDGRYITMDVGAGTVDFNAFFRRSGQWVRDRAGVETGSDYYAVQVEPLGVARIAELQDRSPYKGGRSPSHEWGIEPMPENVLMGEVRKGIAELFEKALDFQHNLGELGKQTWDRDTFFYIWGGGSNRRSYVDNFARGLREAGIAHPDVNHLPTPQDFSVPAGVDFGRLAIAYGLSFNIMNLEKVKLPGELETFEQVAAAAGGANTMQQQMEDCTCNGLNPDCARCNGLGFVMRWRRG